MPLVVHACECTNMWTSGHMISMKNYKAAKKKMSKICLTAAAAAAKQPPCCEYFPSYAVFSSIELDHTLSVQSTCCCCCFRLSHFLCEFCCNNNTVAAAVTKRFEWLWCDWKENGFVGDYDNSLVNISWHISWITWKAHNRGTCYVMCFSYERAFGMPTAEE